MLRRFLTLSVGVFALLLLLGTPGQLHAQRMMRGGSPRMVRPMPGFNRGMRFDPRFHHGAFDPRFHRGTFDPRFHHGMFDPRFHHGRFDPRFHRGTFDPFFFSPRIVPFRFFSPF